MSQPQEQEDAIFAAALHLPAAEWGAFLAAKCQTDTHLRTRIESRLASQTSAATMTGSPDDEKTIGTTLVTGGVLKRGAEEARGDAIGQYTLVEKIGEGGCGIVYLAEQSEPIKRHVALKITKLGMDTKQVVARFEAERQALALMDHPYIASVIDGGATDTGRPFFVMELVRGTRITEYCDEHKLSTRKRLRLFIQVCQAIEHAHQKGILHRDIKPSNILVGEHDGRPSCKVIDFGIAKATQGALSEKTIYTQVDQFIGTPAYMSPEQAAISGEELDARTDIYSLGVLLYELLTGYTPFESKGLLARGFDEMRRIIREMEPVRPSNRLGKDVHKHLTKTAARQSTDVPKLINVIRGDLDWIAMKCLEKDRSRRYSSAAELSDDIERFLADEPVTARPPSKWYRFSKLVSRNRLAFAGGGVFFATLIAGLCVLTDYVIKESDARLEAERAVQSATVARNTELAALDHANAERKSAEDAEEKAMAALAESESDRLKAEKAAHDENTARQEAEAARKKAEDALNLADAEHRKAVSADESARQSKSDADAAKSDATTAETRSEEATRAAAAETVRRQQAETARAEAETARAQALAAQSRAESARVAAESAATAAQAESARLSASILSLTLDFLLDPNVISNSPEGLESVGRALSLATDAADPGQRQLALGLTEYRSSHYSEAANSASNLLSTAGAAPARAAAASALLAMARSQLKQTNAAAALAQASQYFETNTAKLDTNTVSRNARDWEIAKMLLKEAKAAMPDTSTPKDAGGAQ